MASVDATESMYREMVDDLNFLNGDQWPQKIKSERMLDFRPCLTINKLPTFQDRIVGDQRQNRPSIKVRPVDSQADPETAQILNGLIKNIEVISAADVAYDTAFESVVACGLGAFRIVTDYADDDVFNQDILIKRIANTFTVYWDPSAQELSKADGRYMFVTEMVSEEEFENQYPNAAKVEFDASRDDLKDWADGQGNVRVAEYFVKEPIKRTLYLMTNPETRDQVTCDEEKLKEWKKEGYQVTKEREVETTKIVWYKLSGREILEGPTDWAGRYFPIVLIWGKEINIEGKSVYRGIVRHAKDPCRLYNYNRSMGAETVALAPRAPYIATAKQIGPFKGMWDAAHKKNFFYLLTETDPQAPGVPQRQFPSQISTGIQNEILIADQEIHDTVGLQLASMGKKSNEKSGKAVEARQREGDIGTFAFMDNLVRGLVYAGKVIIDLIPRIYDTERVMRILGDDGTEKIVTINGPYEDKKTGKVHIFDLTTGKYDVEVKVGPSFATQRQESAASMLDFIAAVPPAGMLVADLIAKNMDWPGADEFEKRLKLLLPPQLQEPEEGAPGQPGMAPDQMQQGQPMPPGPPPEIQAGAEAMAEIEIETAEVKLAQEKLKVKELQEKVAGLELDNIIKASSLNNPEEEDEENGE